MRHPIQKKLRTALPRSGKLLWSGAPLALAIALLLPQQSGVAKNVTHPLDEVYRSATGTPLQQSDPSARLRRLSLQLRGVIPTRDEILLYQKSDPERRDRVFATRFIQDADFAHYWGFRFASLLRERTNERKGVYGGYYRWIAESIHNDRGWDAIATDLINAEGDVSKNPAAHFYLRDGGDPLQVAEYVSRLFYGKRLSCARCHDHPTEDFTRRDYYGMAAFFSQVWLKKGQKIEFISSSRLEHFSEKDKKEYESRKHQWYRDVWHKMNQSQQKRWRKENELKYAVAVYEPKLQMRFPYSDDSPGGDLVDPKFPDGTKPTLPEGADRRKVFTSWLTSKENDRFRKVLINRVWTLLMGWSFFEPLDDWNSKTEIRHPEILNHLDRVFYERKFSIKDLVYYIVTSDSWARSAPPPGAEEGDSSIRWFQPVRMDPAQLFNSLLRATDTATLSHINERNLIQPQADPSSFPDLRGRGKILSPVEKQNHYSNACEIPRPPRYNSFFSLFGEGDRNDLDNNNEDPNIEQVLVLINGQVVSQVSWNYGKENSTIQQEWNRHKSMEKVIETLYLSALSRAPREKELSTLAPMASGRFSRDDGKFNQPFTSDLMWSLINSREFIHVH